MTSWSKEAPTVPGFFWWRRLDSKPVQPAQILHVQLDDQGLWIDDPVLGYDRHVCDVSGEWQPVAGPLP